MNAPLSAHPWTLADCVNEAVARATRRKQRLMACALTRTLWPLLPRVCRKAVETAERFADGQADVGALRVAVQRSERRAAAVRVARPPIGYAADASSFTVQQNPEAALRGAATHTLRALLLTSHGDDHLESRLCALLLEILGEAPPDQEEYSYRYWEDGLVVRFARGIYDNRRYGDLPLLHDALLDAGCSDESLLAHCRQPTGHVRGCWALDRILGW